MNINAYRNKSNMDYIKMTLKKYSHRSDSDNATEIAAVTSIPIIAVFQLIGEYKGFSEEIERNIKNLREFYND